MHIRVAAYLLPTTAVALTFVALAIDAPAAQCEPLPRGIAGWWPGDGTSDDLTLAANHGALINGATVGPGVIGNAFILDGINDRVDVPDAPALRPTQFTLAAWIRLDTLPAGSCIICKQFGNGDLDSYSLWISGGVLRGGMFGFVEAVGTSQIPVNQVLHTAVTYDGAIIRLYLDGQMIAATAGPASPVPYDTNQVIIGAEDNGTNAFAGFFDGMIDEPQIFSRALSPCEIRALARARPQGSCKGNADGDAFPDFQDNCPAVSNAAQTDADADGVGDSCDCAPADSGVYASPGDRNDLRFEARDRLDWCRDPSFSGPSTLYDVVRGDLDDLPVASATSECRSRCLAPLSGLVAWWPGDGATTDLIAANNGTLLNGAGYGGGFVRGAFTLDGIDDRVATGNLTLGNTFTVTAWVNSALVNQGGYRRIVETNFATGFALVTDVLGNGYKFIVKSPSSPFGAANGGKIVPGEWQFVAGTYDGTTGVLYVDGIVAASAPFGAPGVVSLPVNVGAYFGGGFPWKGRIDEVQIYDRTLSAAEIRALYDAGCAGSCKMGLGGINAEWTVPFAADGTIPAAARGFYYLYRGRNSCGTGSYGFATSGAERISTACN